MTPQSEGYSFEKELAEEFGLERVSGSGSVWHSKLDLVGEHTRWSLKSTTKLGFPLKAHDILEAEQACFGPGGDGKIPVWAVRIPRGDFIVMRKEDFKDMQAGSSKMLNIIEEDRPQVAARKKRASQPELLRDLDLEGLPLNAEKGKIS